MPNQRLRSEIQKDVNATRFVALRRGGRGFGSSIAGGDDSEREARYPQFLLSSIGPAHNLLSEEADLDKLLMICSVEAYSTCAPP